jgi:putative transposase
MKFLDKALREAFDKKNPQRFPRFKKKGQGIDSFRYPQGFKLEGDRQQARHQGNCSEASAHA